MTILLTNIWQNPEKKERKALEDGRSSCLFFFSSEVLHLSGYLASNLLTTPSRIHTGTFCLSCFFYYITSFIFTDLNFLSFLETFVSDLVQLPSFPSFSSSWLSPKRIIPNNVVFILTFTRSLLQAFPPTFCIRCFVEDVCALLLPPTWSRHEHVWRRGRVKGEQ